jgi:DNA polymerase III alpha subunit (gram-positive type)
MDSTIIVFDFETTHLEAGTTACDAIELAACAIHSKTLEIVKDSEFFVNIRPDNIEDPDYYKNHKSTIDWHVGLHKGNTVEGLIEKWKAGTPEKQAWKMFHDYVNQYNHTKTWRTAPIAAGTNISDFDLKIYDYLNQKHKMKPCFHKRDKIDIKDLCFYWFAFNPDPPKSFKMDDLRPYFALGTEKAHNALFDVQQEATIISNFLKVFKKYGKQVTLRGMCGKTASAY